MKSSLPAEVAFLIEDLKDQLETSRGYAASLESKLDHFKSLNEESNMKLISLENEIHTLNHKIESRDLSISQLESSLHQSNERITYLESSHELFESTQQALHTMTEQANEFSNRAMKAEQELISFKQEQEWIQQQHYHFETKLSDLKHDLQLALKLGGDGFLQLKAGVDRVASVVESLNGLDRVWEYRENNIR